MAKKRTIGLLKEKGIETEIDVEGIQIFKETRENIAEEIPNLFVLTSALALPRVAKVAQLANRVGHLKGLLIQQERDLNWITSLMDRAGLRQLRHTFVHCNFSVFNRILNAWHIGAEKHLIADATVQEDTLLVRNCALETMDVEVDKIGALRKLSREEIVRFNVAEDGAYLYWPDGDIHLDLESIRVAKDPELRAEFQIRRAESDEVMGRAIRRIRKQAGLRQKDIEALSPRQVRRIEKAKTSPTTSNLRHFANAHGLELNDYLNQVAREMNPPNNNTKEPHAAE